MYKAHRRFQILTELRKMRKNFLDLSINDRIFSYKGVFGEQNVDSKIGKNVKKRQKTGTISQKSKG